MYRKIILLILGLLISGFFMSKPLSAKEESLTITTYYPAPYGVYRELTTTNNTYLATEGGNVGIGTEDPEAELGISRDEDDFVGIYITNTHTGSNSSEGIYFKNEDGTHAGIRLYDDENDAYPSQMHIFNNRSNGMVRLRTRGAAEEGLTIVEGGNMGIGTTELEENTKLHINNTDGPAIVRISANEDYDAGLLLERGIVNWGFYHDADNNMLRISRDVTQDAEGNPRFQLIYPSLDIAREGVIAHRSSGRSIIRIISEDDAGAGSEAGLILQSGDSHIYRGIYQNANGEFRITSGVVMQGVLIGDDDTETILNDIDLELLTPSLSINTSGNVGIGESAHSSFRLSVNGVVYADDFCDKDGACFSTWSGPEIIGPGGIRVKPKGVEVKPKSPSDLHFKKDIERLDGALAKLDNINAIKFNWRQEEFKDFGLPEGRQIGLVAQEVEKEFPELVSTDDEGYKYVDYARFVGVLVEAVKELKAENQALEVRIRQLER